MNDSLLIPYHENALVKADRQVSIANKAIARIDSKRFARLIKRHYTLFKHTISRLGDLHWTNELIGQYIDKWDWDGLSINNGLPWSVALIEKYKDRWDWKFLSCNVNLPWSEELIEKYKDKWYWTWLSDNSGLSWSGELIEKYEDRWDWEFLSANVNLPWSEELIEKYEDRWDWEATADGKIIFSKLLKKYGENIIHQMFQELPR